MRRGYLYDLYELIDADAELSREDFFPNILAAMETDGKLYSISPAFGVLSLVGSAEVLGEEMGWTLQELMEVVKAHPEAEYLLDPGHDELLDTPGDAGDESGRVCGLDDGQVQL